MKRFVRLLPVPILIVVSAIGTPTLAQQTEPPPDNTAGRPKVVSIPNIQGPADSVFDANGTFGVRAPGVHNPLIQSGGSFTTADQPAVPGRPPSPPVHAQTTVSAPP